MTQSRGIPARKLKKLLEPQLQARRVESWASHTVGLTASQAAANVGQVFGPSFSTNQIYWQILPNSAGLKPHAANDRWGRGLIFYFINSAFRVIFAASWLLAGCTNVW